MKLRNLVISSAFRPFNSSARLFILSRSIRFKKDMKKNSKIDCTNTHRLLLCDLPFRVLFFQLVFELQRVLLQKCTLCKFFFFFFFIERLTWLVATENFYQNFFIVFAGRVHKTNHVPYQKKCNYLWFKGGEKVLSLFLFARVLKSELILGGDKVIVL